MSKVLKRLCILLLCVALVMGDNAICVLASETEKTVEVISDVAVENVGDSPEDEMEENEEELVSTTSLTTVEIDGKEWYEIRNAEELVEFLTLVYSGENTINGRLVNDIDMEGVAYPKINFVYFEGHFNGQNYTIRNLTTNYGLFYGVKGRVERVRLENINFKSAGVAGTVMDGVIENCYVQGSVSGAGIVNSASSSVIRNCYSDVTLKTTSGGGIVGSSYEDVEISNCGAIVEFYQPESYQTNMGEIVGRAYKAPLTIKNCYCLTNYIIKVSSSTEIINRGVIIGGYESSVLGGLTFLNNYDLTQNDYDGMEDSEVELWKKGKLTLLLNESETENVTWYQDVESGAGTLPQPFYIEEGIVYEYINCRGEYDYTNHKDYAELAEVTPGRHVFLVDDSYGERCRRCNKLASGIYR